MKKLIFFLILVAVAVGVWIYMQKISEEASKAAPALKPSEKYLKEEEDKTGK